jgi:trehalose 6-phosphate phosphatase
MRHLFDEAGQAALQALMRSRPLLAFDFDGTLAPIVARPDDAHIPDPLARRLERLATAIPVAIVTGRAVADVRARLGFAPTFVVGNHGAEDETQALPQPPLALALDALRAAIAQHAPALAQAGVAVEDKGLSLAFHYRLAADPLFALALIRNVVAQAPQGLHVFDGKRVVNAVAAGAPDKAHAVHRLRARCSADGVLFAGDDINDEPVFAAAEPGWVTVRIGNDGTRHSLARWFLHDTQEMAPLLDRLIDLLALPPAPA